MDDKIDLCWCLYFDGPSPGVAPDGNEIEFHQMREQQIKKFLMTEIDNEIDYRLRNKKYNIKSFGDFINKLAQPFYDSFEIYRGLRSSIIKMLRKYFFKFAQMVLMIQTGHIQIFEEVLQFGHIQNIDKQNLWKRHWNVYLDYHKKYIELSNYVMIMFIFTYILICIDFTEII